MSAASFSPPTSFPPLSTACSHLSAYLRAGRIFFPSSLFWRLSQAVAVDGRRSTVDPSLSRLSRALRKKKKKKHSNDKQKELPSLFAIMTAFAGHDFVPSGAQEELSAVIRHAQVNGVGNRIGRFGRRSLAKDDEDDDTIREKDGKANEQMRTEKESRQ
ncbi:unnamed protein product [Calypogeia fissa]